ncbi:ERAD-associated E3 ubiquitin-protein ligase component HRD3A isoform X2 [Abrus precatorius]|uniref:ERAD-associated E3 ubiquitin-protein ligase component HRD3A isoform X2 n=1 Tax=Abrus precatorius TaxID=3816 RepID=A0A8B8K9T4_ABRPR|nr:ERAD-associated E3 ubiquitin-protein ligase component HRD3A isoform X2 [Abrus precatorius]
MQNAKLFFLSFSLLTLSLSVAARPFVLVLSQEDFKDDAPSDPDSAAEWDEFGDSDTHKSEDDLDPGSWRPIFEPSSGDPQPLSESEAMYYSAVEKLLSADATVIEEGAGEIETAAESGYPPAQSVLGFLWGMGLLRERSKGKAFLYHHFAAEGGNMQSKMALAYTYTRQDMFEKAVKLYAELAEVAVNSFLISKDSPVIEPVRLHNGAEENKEALRKSKGEEDDDFQILEYQAQKGNAAAMYKVGLFYYFGLRGLRRDHSKALSWFLKAAYNGMGYLYVKGYGVDKKNYTKAKEYFEKAADNEEVGGHYNLGVMYLKGIGVKRDVKLACTYFVVAANHGQPKAFYQLAKIFHIGVGFKKNIPLATALYKLVAERGPWSSLSRWALESYLKGDVGKAFMLYSRMAEMGYEVAQSNAAWILDKYGERSMCMGESGFCTDAERHQRAHSLWWQASEQGNEHAALLIGDAYYYGRGTARDYDRAAEAYMHAKSQFNAQAMFNLGYMHEHGQGLPFDFHLAKRYYDEALEHDPAAKLPVTLALTSLWVRKNYADSFLVHMIDSLPEVYPKLEAWVENVLLEEGNATILTLFACLLTVLYLRERQRRQAAVVAAEGAQPNRPNELGVPAPM